MTALARWCLRRRLAVVVLWLVALAGTAAAAALAGSSYSEDYRVPGTESGRATALLERDFPGRGGDDTIVWHTTSGTVRSADVRQRMSHTLREVAALPGVASVDGPYTGSGGGISPDGRTAYADLTFRGDGAGDPDVGQVRTVVTTARAAAGDGLDVALGGSSIGLTEGANSHLSELVGIVVAAVVLFVVFGSLAACLLPIATALVGVGTAAAGTVLLGHLMPVAGFAPMLGTLIGLGVGIDYALFIVTRHRKGLRQGLSVPEAAERAVATTGRAVVFAGGTVCAALLGMLVLRLDFLIGVALAASLTVLLTVAASLTLLPALLGFMGRRVLGRRERRAVPGAGLGPDAPAGLAVPTGSVASSGPGAPTGLVASTGPTGPTGLAAPAAPTDPTAPTGLAARWSALVERRPKLLAAVAAAVMLVLALPAFALHLGTSDQGNNPASSTTRQAYDLLADGFGPGVNGPLTLVAELDGAGERLAFDRLPARLRDMPGIASVGPATHGRGGASGVIAVVPDSSPQSRATSDLVRRLRAETLPRATAGTGLDVHVGGPTAAYDDFAAVIRGKLPLFVGTVVGLGCVLLLLAFRSVGIPLKAAAMNIAAVASSFGLIVAVFQWGWGSESLGLGRAGPIEPFLPVVMIAVLFGLSMDYQVFLVSRMYEEWLATRDNRRAVRVGLAETSRVINSAAIIMISVFLAFVLSGDRVIAMFGIGLASAVALDAFVLRTLLVPALMHLLGGANWWLPGWLDRRLPRISIEPPEPRPTRPLPTPLTGARPEREDVRPVA
ncbi:MMPL family transporter [Streptomyces mobaraensis]|uniref:MMPL family transporter n=1 Tax=Streptomyces mobaraensis TaxID=35621 RepID=A0A5N5W3B8_STRMB|nr:MMPL family transporter [Streptomyces mobaraensis]KAB7836080.1 MMPL family transporter [Streptomyces mobaraensis]